jgi:putative flippase GtrA
VTTETLARPARRADLRKWARYGSVSAVSTMISMTTLGVLVATNAVGAGWANVIATAAGTAPSFELNRRWVWGRRGRRSLWAEIGPFCVLSFTGLALSTLAVSLATRWVGSMGLGAGARTLAAEAANVAAFGTLWVAQFFILDRLPFASHDGAGCGQDDEVTAELHDDSIVAVTANVTRP